jgi:predicted dinucleotide-utilizing enzyme
MIKVSILKCCTAFDNRFKEIQNSSSKLELVQVYSRKVENLTHLLDLNQIATRIEDLSEVDLYIIAVSDDAIASVSKQLIFKIDL